VTTSQLLVGLLLAALVWLAARWQRRFSGERRRRRLEDALKHLFEQEYRGRRGSLSSLAGALRLTDNRVVPLVGQMQQQGLLLAHGQEFQLTPEGERFALQIVRAHRLLERYLADEARLPLGKVHAVAERREHALSKADVERLSASLGHPLVDPHGDPIPSREGKVAPAEGTPATAWPADTTGRVVHLEDEPEISFAQIIAEGLRVGQLLRIIDSTPERIVLSDGENEFRLAPAVAANVFLAPAPDAVTDPSVVRLHRPDHGQRLRQLHLVDRTGRHDGPRPAARHARVGGGQSVRRRRWFADRAAGANPVRLLLGSADAAGAGSLLLAPGFGPEGHPRPVRQQHRPATQPALHLHLHGAVHPRHPQDDERA
jgi:DtxR family Mn-dependent transcriptional regulator